MENLRLIHNYIKTVHESSSRMPADAIATASFTYVSAMKYSTVLIPVMLMCETDVQGNVALLDWARGINTAILLVNGQGNHKRLLISEIYSAVVWHCSGGNVFAKFQRLDHSFV